MVQYSECELNSFLCVRQNFGDVVWVYIKPAMRQTAACDSSTLAKNWPRRATKIFLHRVFCPVFGGYPHELAPEKATSSTPHSRAKRLFSKIEPIETALTARFLGCQSFTTERRTA